MRKRYANLKELLENELRKDHRDTDRGTREAIDLVRQLKHVRKKGYFTRPEFLKMCRWKSWRTIHLYSANTSRQIEGVARAVLATTDERRRMELLDSLKGVGIPTASAT